MENEVTRTCEGCRYFKQHYVRTQGNRYTPTYCGHCANPKLRDKKPDAPACHRFANG